MREFKEKGTPDLVTCDICKEETIEVDSLSEWVKSGRTTGWIVVSHSPVPYGGMDCCPKCKDLLTDDMDKIIKQINISGQDKNVVLGKFVKMLVDQIMFGRGEDGLE